MTAVDISQICYRYEAKLNAENEVIADWLVRLTTNQRKWGRLALHLFETLDEIQDFATRWLWTYSQD
nr:hypothetical protein [uncultured Duganella sp.]